jgi:hypothetical protein
MVSKKRKEPTGKINHYVITLQEGIFEKEKIDWFHRQPSIYITRINKKGRTKTIDLKDVVFRVDLLRQNSLGLDIKENKGKMVRPAEFLSTIFGLSDVVIKKATIIKGMANV